MTTTTKTTKQTVLNFTRTFTRGNLEGITIPQTLNFLSQDLANDWVRMVNKFHAKGGLPYFVEVISYE